MPAFDPVRDAVLNSPVTTTSTQRIPSPSLSLSARPERPGSISNNVNDATPLPSPSLGRRATDLAVLLNDETVEPLSRSSPLRTSSLAHILHSSSSDGEDDKLSVIAPFRRALGPPQSYRPDSQLVDDLRQQEGCDIHRERLGRTSSLSRHHQPPLPLPLTESPEPLRSRPSTASSSLEFTMDIRRSPRVPVTSAQQAIPYNPKRITPAGSVLIPMSAEEMEKMRLFRGRGTERLMASRKRERSPATHEEGEPPTKKLSAGDVEVVVQHYNSRPEVGIAQRGESPIIGLKSFNNWIKSVIISKFAHPAFNRKPEVPNYQGVGKVLDMGCGKGGDMTKWGKARIKLYVGADIASVSVEQARQRWQTMRGHRFDAKFAAVDCYTQSLATVFPSEVLVPPFDVVSMQFCMHYAFETETKARCMLQNVTQWLRPGGVFIGTIPNADLLLDRLDELPPGSDDYTFGNSVYRIRFESRDYRPIYGHKYWFYLKDAVDDVPEYVVDWDEFCELAEEYGLRLTYKKTFHEVYSENEEHAEFGPLLVRMKVVGTNGACAIDDEQWEAANIYIAFAFEKKA